jgi:hypothetical protein
MTEGQTQFKVDKTNLIKAGRIPVIAAAIGGALWLLGFLGGLMGILFWVVAAFAGYWYVNLVLKSGAKPSILEVAINGAILGAVVGLVYAVVSWIAISIRYPGLAGGLVGFGYRWGFGSIIRTFLEGAIGGAIGAAGWYAYKSGMIKTK